MPYKLSAILDGHSNDVRAVAPLPGGSIISGSRDKTVKLWASNSDQSWSPQVVYEGHTNYVSCLAVMPGILISLFFSYEYFELTCFFQPMRHILMVLYTLVLMTPKLERTCHIRRFQITFWKVMKQM